MRFQILTLFPKMIEAFLQEGVIGQARQKNLIQVQCHNPRAFTENIHQSVDDRPYGGGDGMVMMGEPLQKTLQGILQEDPKAWVVYLSPQGIPLNQEKVKELYQKKNLVLISGRYGGVDQRFLNRFVHEEISIGDYILSGGELAAGVIIDAISRLVPGSLGHRGSAESDSFADELQGLLEVPSFTRPSSYLGEEVPPVLLSGNHTEIAKWKRKVSKLVTALKRPDLLIANPMSTSEIRELQNFWIELDEEEKKVLGLSTLSQADLELLKP
jgi:tRNA (guanine37-N1)-methyltransferase